jgi:hypothetical protein
MNSFSGSDLLVSFANKVLGNMQSISWGTQREKVPVFTLGSADARSVSRGKRAIGGALIMATFDQDALLQTMKEIWDKIAPPAMFTAAGNIAKAGSEDFSKVLDLSNWNAAATSSYNSYNIAGKNINLNAWFDAIRKEYASETDSIKLGHLAVLERQLLKSSTHIAAGRFNDAADIIDGSGETISEIRDKAEEAFRACNDLIIPDGESSTETLQSFVDKLSGMENTNTLPGYSGAGSLQPLTVSGSNNVYKQRKKNGQEVWEPSSSQIYTPQGFSVIRGDNILYSDMLPPFDVTLTFANEYGQCAFKKIYDLDILNEGSGVSVDTIVMENQMSYIARRISPLIRGVYSRSENGSVYGKDPISQ